jgi:hypothetical protein
LNNAFKTACEVETEAMAILIPFIEQKSIRYVLTNKGNVSKELQKTCGDALINSDDGTIWAIEIKAERRNKTGNFYLETWSNRKWYTVGWMFNLNTDILLYFFLEDMLLYSIKFRDLRHWAFVKGRIYDFQEKPQTKYSQLNDTWGRCVPIGVIGDEVGFTQYNL